MQNLENWINLLEALRFIDSPEKLQVWFEILRLTIDITHRSLWIAFLKGLS